MLNVYEKHKDKDGYLYIVYTEETSLGQWWVINIINNVDKSGFYNNMMIHKR